MAKNEKKLNFSDAQILFQISLETNSCYSMPMKVLVLKVSRSLHQIYLKYCLNNKIKKVYLKYCLT